MNIGSTLGSVMQTTATTVPPLTEDVQKATKQVDQASSDRPVEDVQSLSANVTDMKQGQQQSDANAKLVQTADEAVGSLIDTKA